jgi:hypothetical protein
MIMSPRVPHLGFGVGSWGASTSKTKYSLRPIAHQYREGKLKSTPGGV